MADYVSPDARRRIATGLMAAQYAENPPTAPMGYDFDAAPLSPGLMNFAAQRGQPGVIQKTLGLIPGFDQDGKRGAQSWGNALMSTAQFPIDAVAGMGQALTAPARAYRGEFDPTSEEGVGEALNVAGNAMMGGLAAPKPRNVVGSAGGDLKGAALGAIPDQAALMDRTLSRFGKSSDPASAALDMSHAARMQRARSMGYDTDTTWYHGTSAPNFDEFSPGKRGATFFSDKPYVTDYFANTSRTDGPARVIPTYSRANKLFDPAKEADNPNLAAYVADNINQYDVKSIINPGKTHTRTPHEVLTELRNSSFGKDMFEPVEHPVIQNWIKNNGYDGFVVNDGSWMAMSADKPARIMGVFDPSKIRSTNAAFDPAKTDSANLLYANGGRPGATAGAALGAIPDTPGIRAYHGSPHDFDRFDMSKIGTGEGAQAYGHGLYFAEREGVARSYRDALGGQKLKDGTPFDELNPSHWAADAINRAGGDRAKAAQLVAADMTPDMKMYDGGQYQRLLRAKGMLERNEAVPDIGSGKMYEVNIKAHPDDFLDWDKPLSQQSEKVKTGYLDALGKLGHPNPQKVMDSSFASSGGGLENLLNAWSKYDRSKASGALNEAGIPGIRYLDQGSRAGGEGSRNLVVFDDKLIEILRKYGLLGMAGGAAAAEYGFGAPQSRPASPQYRPGDA